MGRNVGGGGKHIMMIIMFNLIIYTPVNHRGTSIMPYRAGVEKILVNWVPEMVSIVT